MSMLHHWINRGFSMDERICDLMKKGIDSLGISKFQEALVYFNEILEIDKDNLAALNNKSLALNGLSKFDEAIVGFDKILQYDCKFYFSLVGKGESLYYLDFYDAALEYFNRALELNSNYDSAWYGKARVLYEFNQYDEALKCFNILEKISGVFWLDDTIYKKCLKESKKVKFNKRGAFIEKINQLIDEKKFSEVLTVLDEALKFDSKSTFFMCNKSYALYKLGNYDEALIYVDKILEIDFMNLTALNIKSKICVKLNKYDDAFNCLNAIDKFGGVVDGLFYQEVISNTSDYDEVYDLIQQGNYYLVEQDYEEALCCFDEALDIDSTDIIALNNKGFTLYLLNNYTEAIKIFNQALMVKNDYIYSLLGKSYSLFYLNEFEGSLECYNKILSQNSDYCDENYLKLLNKVNNI